MDRTSDGGGGVGRDDAHARARKRSQNKRGGTHISNVGSSRDAGRFGSSSETSGFVGQHGGGGQSQLGGATGVELRLCRVATVAERCAEQDTCPAHMADLDAHHGHSPRVSPPVPPAARAPTQRRAPGRLDGARQHTTHASAHFTRPARGRWRAEGSAMPLRQTPHPLRTRPPTRLGGGTSASRAAPRAEAQRALGGDWRPSRPRRSIGPPAAPAPRASNCPAFERRPRASVPGRADPRPVRSNCSHTFRGVLEAAVHDGAQQLRLEQEVTEA